MLFVASTRDLSMPRQSLDLQASRRGVALLQSMGPLCMGSLRFAGRFLDVVRTACSESHKRSRFYSQIRRACAAVAQRIREESCECFRAFRNWGSM